MPKQPTSVGLAEKRALAVADEMGLELVDVELCKESAGRFLRFYIDKPEGVGINDCEAFHRALLKLMDDIDYDYMEVSSPGADRPLKKPRDFERAAGENVEVRLYKPIDGAKIFTGRLIGLNGGIVTVEVEGRPKDFELKKVALVKLAFEVDQSVFEEPIGELQEDENGPDV